MTTPTASLLQETARYKPASKAMLTSRSLAMKPANGGIPAREPIRNNDDQTKGVFCAETRNRKIRVRCHQEDRQGS